MPFVVGTGTDGGLSFGKSAIPLFFDASTGTVRLNGDFLANGKLWHNGTTVGLYGKTPVTQPTRAGQLTDNSGGTSGGNTIAAIGGAVDTTAALRVDTANAIATLAAKINAIENKLSAAGTGIGVTA